MQRGYVDQAVGLQPDIRVREDDARPRPQRVLRRLLAQRRHRVLRQPRQDHQGVGSRYRVRSVLYLLWVRFRFVGIHYFYFHAFVNSIFVFKQRMECLDTFCLSYNMFG